jgi:nicotinamide mononucleotide transporter
LQLVFIAAAVAGWYGWEPTGAQPGPFKNKYRIYTIAAILIATLALGPVLKWAGAASTYVDAILFFGSLAAQILMVYEKYDNWPMWLVVDAGYTALYASQGLLLQRCCMWHLRPWLHWDGVHGMNSSPRS